MTYPDTFETKIGFDAVRRLLLARCLCPLGKELVDAITMSTDANTVRRQLRQISQWRQLEQTADSLPLNHFIDVRQPVARLRLSGTYMTEDDLFDLRHSLDNINTLATLLRATTTDDNTTPLYPDLAQMTDDITVFPNIVAKIDTILDKYGHIKDNASPALATIRTELARARGSISSTLTSILRAAQRDGLVDKDVSPTLRDGRLVIPVAPALKRRLHGIVHDESATGKTVFIEPAEVVEANNRVRELEADEQREIIRILKTFAEQLRPHTDDIVHSYQLLARVDYTRARAALAQTLHATEPDITDRTIIDWTLARHPLLTLTLQEAGKQIVPLDITLNSDKRILIISGPNAGGKSVCLKTVGLLQYMVQCGLAIPVGESSKVGIFNNIMIDIGDEQSIEDDLSTYSSHLANMKAMIRQADNNTLLLIDEFGTGTEPQIGGAIAEAVLKRLSTNGAYAVITTHYQNLKSFQHTYTPGPGEAVANGAMLYDRQKMQALFQLAIGRPGSSFAIEIARKTGLPETVIQDATDIVGNDYIQSDKYLQDIARDKRYWENKRQTIHQIEKQLKQQTDTYEKEIADLKKQQHDIIAQARAQAEELLREANRRIENTIREIREGQAEKEKTKTLRAELKAWTDNALNTSEDEERIARKIRQIQGRRDRHERRKAERAEQDTAKTKTTTPPQAEKPLQAGDTVRIRGLKSIGTIEAIDGQTATVLFGDMRTRMPARRLEHCQTPQPTPLATGLRADIIAEGNIARGGGSRLTREIIDQRKANFHQDLDVRGMRAEEAINAVTYFIDDATLLGMTQVRILHGTGTGALREAIRQWLATMTNVSNYRDEHVQLGGHGITVVEIRNS